MALGVTLEANKETVLNAMQKVLGENLGLGGW